MMRFLAGIAVGLSLGAASAAEEKPAERLFLQRIQPLLVRKCYACHGDAKKLEGALDLRTRSGLLKGGESGTPALVPGRPEESPLYLAVTRRDKDRVMPPKENDKLSAEEIEWVRTWIATGAPWPSKPVASSEWNHAEGIQVTTSGGQSADWTNRRYKPEDVWAFQSIRRPTIPPITNPQSAANPIDAFLQARLASKGLEAAPPADRLTLLRRSAFDLTGLPPGPDVAETFLNDASPLAFERLVERLLSSPSYGERMAQHWLDVVRYADTDGFANDFERPHAWRYRDYVIKSFLEDKPFDRFVLEQIAGDELLEEDAGETLLSQRLIATGFLRMGPWEQTAMSVAAVQRQLWLDDVTQTVGVTFLAQGLRCAKCHDHKFDPVPTRDYYRIQAVFASTRFADRPAPFSDWENTSDLARRRAALQASGENPIDVLVAAKGTNARTMIAKKHDDYRKRALLRFEAACFSVTAGSDEPTHVLVGGALESPGELVTPGVLSALSAAAAEEVRGRRLALARWIASPQNPLTARVIVNRVWQWHFGQGLVATPNNFGKMGARPSHPELLDWLAAWFIDQGWSVKKLHALIMSSAAYRQSAKHPHWEKLREVDPRNELVAYYPPRRLSAEEIRDAMLAASGELNTRQGGPGVFPEINWEVALQPRHIMGGIAPAYLPSLTRQERNRRTIYAFRYRTLGDPLLEVLNRPSTEMACERRDDTTVAPQALALFNGRFVHDRALALARRLEESHDDPAARIARAFDLLYGRAPTDQERQLCENHVARMIEHHRAHKPESIELPKLVRREMVEEQTGELFVWEERLPLEGYQRDLAPWQVGPETRAMAELCLVLFNSNEFLYVR